ncbi:hypothetical protein P8452_38812 [Trifolium repens]|nr:hypothetical protein P8452_38812 [Trifolium repens]
MQGYTSRIWRTYNHIGGLQILHRDKWIDVRPIPGALVVNIGDVLQLVTNDSSPAPYWKDTFECYLAPNAPKPEDLPIVCRDILLEYGAYLIMVKFCSL